MLRNNLSRVEARRKAVKSSSLASLATRLVLLGTALATVDPCSASVKKNGSAASSGDTISAAIRGGPFEDSSNKKNDPLHNGKYAYRAIGAPAGNMTRDIRAPLAIYAFRMGSEDDGSVPISRTAPAKKNSIEPTRKTANDAACILPTYSACDYPNSTNTGVPPGISLTNLTTNDDCLVVSVDNTVIDGLHITGCIDVEANNVTIQNSRVTATAQIWWAIKYGDSKPNVTGLRILHVKIDSIPGKGPAAEGGYPYGISSQGTGSLEVGYSDISGFKDGINIAHGLVHNNWIHDLSKYAGAHTQGIYLWRAPAGATLLIKHNTITDLVQDSTAAIFMKEGLGIHDVTIEDNWLAGGSFTLYGGGADAKNIQVLNNKFSTEIASKGGQYGPVSYWSKKNSGNWSCNIWANGPNAGRSIAPAY